MMEDDDIKEDDVEEEDQSGDQETHFVRASGIEIHCDVKKTFFRKFVGNLSLCETAIQTLCGPVQLKRMSRFQKSQCYFFSKVTREMPHTKSNVLP